MHHLEHSPFCIIIRFRFGTELHCSCICILNDPVIQGWSYKFYRYNFPPWFLVIVNMNWCGVSAKKSFCIYQSTTRLGRNIGHIMNHNISIQSKIVQQLFVEVWLLCCVTENDFRIFSATKPPYKIRREKAAPDSSLSIKEVVRSSSTYVWVIILVNIKFILPQQTGSQYSRSLT